MNKEPIKSPYSDDKIINIKKIEDTLQNIMDTEDLSGCLYFFLPKDGRVVLGTLGFCGHQMLKIAEMLREKAEERIEEDGEHDCQGGGVK